MQEFVVAVVNHSTIGRASARALIGSPDGIPHRRFAGEDALRRAAAYVTAQLRKYAQGTARQYDMWDLRPGDVRDVLMSGGIVSCAIGGSLIVAGECVPELPGAIAAGQANRAASDQYRESMAGYALKILRMSADDVPALESAPVAELTA